MEETSKIELKYYEIERRSNRMKPKWNTGLSKTAMGRYMELREIVSRKKSKWKEDGKYHLTAMYCETEEDFNLLVEYVAASYTPGCCYADDAPKVKGEFTGSDWYFPKETTIDYGMGSHEARLQIESLALKKNEWNEFLKKYELDYDLEEV